MVITSLENSKQFKEAQQLAEDRLRRRNNDRAGLEALIELTRDQNQIDQMNAYSKRLISSGKPTAGDLNNAAWYALIRGSVTEESFQWAQQSLQLRNNADPSTLHTLASLYAEIGETSQARDLLLRSMELRGLEEPGSDEWYVLGRIAEQIGIRDAAVAAYGKVVKPSKDYRIPDSTYALAQRRLATMAK
jgi:tetratricopeptide (TPR) repeat protein